MIALVNESLIRIIRAPWVLNALLLEALSSFMNVYFLYRSAMDAIKQAVL